MTIQTLFKCTKIQIIGYCYNFANTACFRDLSIG